MCTIVALLALASLDDTRSYYVASRKVVYYHELDGTMYKGTINEAGDFVPKLDFRPRPVASMITSAGNYLRRANRKNEQVYEYRSGRLIPGVLAKGAFVPDYDGKVVDFKTYRWSPTARRIYNLPGTFVSHESFESLKRRGELTEQDLEFNKDR